MSTSQEHADPPSVTGDELRDMAARWLEPGAVPKRCRIVTDTSDFFRVEYDDFVLLGGRPYLVRNYLREGRFGIDEQPKFWVRKIVDLADGSMKILKMTFRERFTARVGSLTFEFIRSPVKEARILAMVRGHPRFMQGFGVKDAAGNTVRVIDYIKGASLADHVPHLGSSHEEYFHLHFPGLLDEFIELVQAIRFLHDRGQKHADIRRDHVIAERTTGRCIWIDFDYNYWHKENMYGYDLFSLGNVLAFIAGRGDITTQQLRREQPAAFARLTADDLNIVFNNRIATLKKVYPYIPDALDLVLRHFSTGASVFYDDTAQLLADLQEVRDTLTAPPSRKEPFP
ncbi:MAG: hypothetical protein AB1805_02485 [Nitrospirota bacterium]